MLVKRPDLLAHSAPRPGSEPDLYEGHVGRVRSGARQRAENMVRFAREPPLDFVANIEVAATFHDIGKLDAENQSAFGQGRAGRMPWDHIDAGVAHLLTNGNRMAAWLVRAHHAPGLPRLAKHFDRDGLGLKLRGLRNDSAERTEHDRQIVRTDTRLSQYLADHAAAVGPVAVSPARASHCLTLRLALSCLVDADYSDTAAFDSGIAPGEPPSPRWQDRLHRLDAYVEELGRSGDGPRNTARADFYQAARDSRISDAFACCEAPVGLGKTTAITAFLLKAALEKNLRHLFIVAPYTNIIDQTVGILREALRLPEENPRQMADVVVAHHHKADFTSRFDRELAVLWRAPVVVTTSVQFFETLAACTPSELRKLHELPGSAVFLDEAHAALPAPLWPQNWRWLRELAEKWNCQFVFASGSLAKFWENRQVIDPPAVLPEIMPPNLGATVIRSEQHRIQYETVGRIGSAGELIERVTREPGPRLLILNTVQSAAVVAQRMREAGKDVLHVSTALCPTDRAPVVDRIRERLTRPGDDWTVVATSCLEAGLDLSFRAGFRERFGTANLIQTGGRVNRDGKYNGAATVFDFILDPVDGVTCHPDARNPGEVLKRQFARGDFSSMSPAALVTGAMAEELKNGRAHDPLSQAEKYKDYPGAAKCGRIITADTRIVVVDSNLAERLRAGERLSFQEILSGSVQVWAQRIEALGLRPVPARQELYVWSHEYDDFLGYMAGVLKMRAFLEAGGEVI